MATLFTNHVEPMIEVREPQSVLEKSSGEPMGVLKHSAFVGHFMPAEAISSETHRMASTG